MKINTGTLASILLFALTLLGTPGAASAYYSPEQGRWLSRDPAEYADGMNTYQYARSNPLRYGDPTGLATECCEGGAIQQLEEAGTRAHDKAVELYPGEERKQNAMRHCIRACDLSERCGISDSLGVLNDRESAIHRILKPGDTKSDKYNNSIGAVLSVLPGSCETKCNTVMSIGLLDTQEHPNEFQNRPRAAPLEPAGDPDEAR